MKSEIKKVIEKGLKNYRIKQIRVGGREYNLSIFSEDEDINIFEGFLFAEAGDKSELANFKKYKAPVSGYAPRLGLIFYKDKFLIKDYRQNRHILKTIRKVNDTFLKKLKKALTDPKAETFNKLFDRTDIIEEFYILYKKSRNFLLDNVRGGTSDGEGREVFVENFMLQMLTLWYLQEKEFFNGDKSYFITKFNELKQKRLTGDVSSYYGFLRYFFDKISNNVDRQYIEDDPAVGKVVVVGPAIFLNGGRDSESISIPEKCFYKDGVTETLIDTPPKKVSADIPILNLFESRDWTEGDMDEFVLGALYEKLITQDVRKKTGAYYTPEEITWYICKNTIEPYLVDRINEKWKKSFESVAQVVDGADRKLLLFLFEQLKDIKILDPAVGSAHFLESAINVLIGVYERIWYRAKELKMRKGLVVKSSDESGNVIDVELLDISSEEQFRLYVKFFIILSRNIYGVDINPGALKIARARLFLTLAKHFDAGRNYFIRFPNVHFNLRDGNSLIGYAEIETPKGDTTLDMFINEEDAVYVSVPIKVVSNLGDYLPVTAKALGISGDIVGEVKALNKILSKQTIDWHDFKTILQTKEKLIKILIVSLNSEHARPLNELLHQITALFNSRLDERFADEHGIDPDELKTIQTFHWVFEFPEVFLDRGGFDVVVGNPPYGGNIHEIEIKFANNYDISKPNIAKVFILKGYDLINEKKYLAFLSPKSLTYAHDWLNLRRFLLKELIEIYDVKEAFKDVLLEQIFFIILKGSSVESYLAKDFFSKESPIKINKERIKDTLICDLSVKDFKIINNFLNHSSLTDFIHTWRGLPLQKYLDNPKGDIEVIAGKNIELYSLKGDLLKVNLDKIPSKFNKNIKKLNQEKIIFQNIVAFISQPVSHIKVMGMYDDFGKLTLDTVNNVELKKDIGSLFFFLGLMNSIFFNWLLHRVAYNKAVRTMHLDNYALGKVPIPTFNKNNVEKIKKSVTALLKHGFQVKEYFLIENEILQLYGIDSDNYLPDDYKIIRDYYENLWDYDRV